MSFGKSKARRMTADSPKVTFADVAGANDRVELFGDAMCGKVELGQVRHDPCWSWVIFLGRGDESGIDVYPNNRVTSFGQVSTDPTRSAPRIEDNAERRGRRTMFAREAWWYRPRP